MQPVVKQGTKFRFSSDCLYTTYVIDSITEDNIVRYCMQGQPPRHSLTLAYFVESMAKGKIIILAD